MTNCKYHIIDKKIYLMPFCADTLLIYHLTISIMSAELQLFRYDMAPDLFKISGFYHRLKEYLRMIRVL